MFFQPRTFFAGYMIIGASITALIALGSFFYCRNFVHTALLADGQITEVLQKQDREHGTLYTSICKFQDFKNVEYTFAASTSNKRPEYQVGELVRVRYSSNDPKSAKIDRFISLWAWPIITSGLTAFCLPFGLILWHWPRIVRRFRNEPAIIPTA